MLVEGVYEYYFSNISQLTIFQPSVNTPVHPLKFEYQIRPLKGLGRYVNVKLYLPLTRDSLAYLRTQF